MKKTVLSVFVSAVVFSCSSTENSDTKKAGGTGENTVEVSVDRLKELDKEFVSAQTLDEKKAKEFISLCMEYADAYPKEKDAALYLEKGAMVAGAIGKYRLKTKLFDFIIERHRGYPNYTNVLYLQAVCWDTEMKNSETAKKYYHMVMEQHKDSGILESTEARLKTIDSLTYDQHVEMLLNKVKSQVQ